MINVHIGLSSSKHDRGIELQIELGEILRRPSYKRLIGDGYDFGTIMAISIFKVYIC